MSFRQQHPQAADVLEADVQLRLWRHGSRESSGRDAIVLLVLQRECILSMPAIRSLQPSPPDALAHSQHILSGRSHTCSGCCS